MEKVELFFETLKNKLLKTCKLCNGTGKNNNANCACMDKFELYVQYHFRGLSQKYWDITLDDWKKDASTKKLIEEYIQNLNNAFNYGLSFLFSGSNGVGKTMLMSIILKEAYKADYKIKFLDTRHLLDKEKSKNAATVDFLALDNFGDEQDFPNKEAYVGAIRQLIWNRVTNIKPTLIATNFNLDQINEVYGRTVFSYIVNTFKAVILSGADFRKIQKNDWEGLLKQ